MDILAVIATCSALTFGTGIPQQSYPYTEGQCREAKQTYQSRITQIKITPQERVALGRVTLAEAANQGEAGWSGVIYTVFNRLVSSGFGDSIQAIINQPGQFEPVTKVGGDWHNLPALTEVDQAKIDTIINLALQGRLPDLTNGGIFFQNPRIVAERERNGQVSKGLTGFYGAPEVAQIKDHTFYAAIPSEVSSHPQGRNRKNEKLESDIMGIATEEKKPGSVYSN